MIEYILIGIMVFSFFGMAKMAWKCQKNASWKNKTSFQKAEPISNELHFSEEDEAVGGFEYGDEVIFHEIYTGFYVGQEPFGLRHIVWWKGKYFLINKVEKK